jgi:phosphoglycolate phosphatase-like HAD superfamily hydrolase
MRKYIVLDLDDTLINTHERHYLVYKSSILMLGEMPLSSTYYFKLRKNGYSNLRVLNEFHKKNKNIFNKYWINNIESTNFLKYDKIIIDLELLKATKIDKEIKLVLLSLRSNKKNALRQINNLGLKGLFDKVFFLKHDSLINPKTDILINLKKEGSILFFAGDSISDMQAAADSSINFIGVSTGLKPISEHFTYENINEVLLKII